MGKNPCLKLPRCAGGAKRDKSAKKSLQPLDFGCRPEYNRERSTALREIEAPFTSAKDKFPGLVIRPAGAPPGGARRHIDCMKHGGKAMKGEAPNMSSKEMAQIRQNLEGTPDIEEAAELMNLAGNSTRLKLLYLLENMKELCVCDLADVLGVSVSAVSQHLAKLKAYGLVAPRRDAQTIYYRLTDHAFNAKLRDNFFKQFQV